MFNYKFNFRYTKRMFIFLLITILVSHNCNQEEQEKETQTKKRIFVTSSTFSGDLGGLAGADEKCQTHAQAANFEGTFKAWLSDSQTDAIDRIKDTGPWYRVDEVTVVFNNKTNLTTTPVNSVLTNEHGSESGEKWVATGTQLGGTKSELHCANWTSSASTIGTDYQSGLYGCVTVTDDAWTQGGSSGYGKICSGSFPPGNCSVSVALYCLEQ
jgi:hypothetical protein